MFGYEDRGAAILLGYAFLVALPIWYLTTYLLSPLRRFPGPYLAGKSTTPLPNSKLLLNISSRDRLDESMAHVSCSTGKIPAGHARTA